MAGPILLNKIGLKKDTWLPRPCEWLELTSTRFLSPSVPPQQTGCVCVSMNSIWALYLCGDKAVSCAAFVQHAKRIQEP